MNAKRLITIANTFLRARIANKKAPLVVGWAITDRCNRSCEYCGRWSGKLEELQTGEVLNIIDELAALGTIQISLTGGEPLIREDIGRIIDHIHSKGIGVVLNSNGQLVKQRIDEIKNLDRLTLSLEGDLETHDSIRGKGSYREVMEAVTVLKRQGIKVDFATVLTKLNLDSIDHVLDKAKEAGGCVTFQPATQLVLGGKKPNPLAPPIEAYQRAIDKLIEKKRRGERGIGDSLACLKHLRRWPYPKKISCASGFISCRIEPSGDVIYCSRVDMGFRPKNAVVDGFKEAFKGLKKVSCNDCWCANRVELNLAFSCKPSAVFGNIRKVFR